MAPPSRSMIGWSWWPLRLPTYILLASFLVFLILDFLLFHFAFHTRPFSMAIFVAIVIAAPYAVVFVIGFPTKPPYDHLRHPARRRSDRP